MKMLMKIDKSQIRSTDKIVPGAGVKVFRRTPAVQAGFKQIDVMCIGGAGGLNTQAALNYWGSGGGGGGSILRRLALSAISEENSYFAGNKSCMTTSEALISRWIMPSFL